MMMMIKNKEKKERRSRRNKVSKKGRTKAQLLFICKIVLVVNLL